MPAWKVRVVEEERAGQTVRSSQRWKKGHMGQATEDIRMVCFEPS